MIEPRRRENLSPERLTAPEAPDRARSVGDEELQRRAGRWRLADVADVGRHGHRGVTLRLAVPDRIPHRPGQHYVVRLRAEDGYTASRSYSVVSAPADELVELYIERVADGEVSSFLAEIVEPGDKLEVRGPIGRWFVWDGHQPALGIGGGSGVAPFVSMLRHAREIGRTDLLSLAVSARTADELPYYGELREGGALVALTQETPFRLDAAALGVFADPTATVYVCGSARFTMAMEEHLRVLGQPVATIRVERFGPGEPLR